MIPLFELYPELESSAPRLALCELPTPLSPLPQLGRNLGLDELYMKNDGLTARPFGGNKIRKLEFILGDAAQRKAKAVLTFGFAGSNHAVATAVHSGRLGMRCITMLLPQSNAHYVRRNLLAGMAAGAEYHYYYDREAMLRGVRRQSLLYLLKRWSRPVVIPPGGSSPLGVLGYINAALEFKKQLESLRLPVPDFVYLPLGTAGTLAGLALGFAMTGMKCRPVPIRIIDKTLLTPEMVTQLMRQTLDFLRPLLKTPLRTDLVSPALESAIRDEFLGSGYARFTDAGVGATRFFRENGDVLLDGTYMGKAAAALMADAWTGKLRGKRVVIWNTLNAYDMGEFIANADYRQLPKALQTYFEDPVQSLDL